MRVQEQSYEEFVAQKVAKGFAESEAGLGIPVEDVKREIQALLEQKAREEYIGEVAYA